MKLRIHFGKLLFEYILDNRIGGAHIVCHPIYEYER